MGRKIIKLLPDKMAYAEKIEFWLNNMAKEGLILKRIGLYFAIFEVGEPQDNKYRVMAFDGYYFSEQVLKACYKADWEVVENDVSPLLLGRTRKTNKYYVFKVDSEAKPHKSLIALHNNTGIDNKRIHEKKLYKRYKRASKTLVVLGILGYVFLYLLYIPGVMLTLSVVLFILSLIQKKEKARINNFEKVDEYNYEDYIPKHIAKTLITLFLRGVTVIYVVALVFSPILLIFQGNLDNVNNFIRLEDVQQAYEKEIEPTYGASIPSLFTPTFYRAEEIGLSKSKEGNTKYIRYEIIHSKVLIPYVSYLAHDKCVARYIKSSASRFLQHAEYTESKHFNKVAYITYLLGGERTVQMCLCNNYETIYLFYQGDKTPDEIIDAIEKTLYE